MTTEARTAPFEDLVAALADGTGAPAPAEVLLGPLTAPARVHGGGDGTGPGVAVLFWCGGVHVLAYDPPHRGDGSGGGGGRDGGCPQCLAWFLTRSAADADTPAEAVPESGPEGDARSRALWRQAGPALRTTTVRVARDLLRGPSPSGALATIDRAAGTVRQGRVPPRAGCPACGPATVATTVPFGSAPELLEKADGTLRARRPLPPTLLSDYLGPHSLFREPLVDLDGPVPTAQVSLPLGGGGREPGVGRTRTFDASRRTAVLEGLERHTGFCRRTPRDTVEATLAELGKRAVDPRTLGCHTDGQYAQEGFPFAPLGADETVRWVPVTPVGDGPAEYLPEAALSWVHRPGERRPFFYDTSNGFALGQSHEEATLHGILEVVERDAFLLAWYRGLLLPELRPGPADGGVRDVMARVETATGFRVRLYWATLDIDIPVVLALARREADNGPCTLVSTAAGLDPRAAAESAIFEVAARVASIRHMYDDDPGHRRRLAEDFGALRTMEDHSLLGALPSSREWFAFLTEPDRPEIGLTEAAEAAPVHAALDEDLEYVRAKVEAAGLDVYAADVTTPELRWRGLVCTRSFVPGCLPMTFGHGNRRLEGLPRLDGGTLPWASCLPPGRTPADVPPHPFA